jgi:MinD superfamily P-loop ATPase
MRFTRKSKDKFMNGISISSSSSSLNKVQTAELVTTPCTARGIETQQIEQTHMVVDQPTGDGNLVSSSTDVSAVLRKVPANLTKQDFKVLMFGSIA